MDRAEAVTLMEKRRQAWLRKDIDTYLSLFSDDLFSPMASSRAAGALLGKKSFGATTSDSHR
jgi:hypothetical protein